MPRQPYCAAQPDLTITITGVTDPGARFTAVIGVLWFVVCCNSAPAVVREDWSSDGIHAATGAFGSSTPLLTSCLLAIHLRRLEVGALGGGGLGCAAECGPAMPPRG